MDYLFICGDEIALEGLDGCPTVKLWSNLEKRCPSMKIDDGVKGYLWKGIVEVLDVKFYSLKEPLPHIFSNHVEEENRKKLNWNEKHGEMDNCSTHLVFNSFYLVHDGDIIGSCPDYETRKDITSEIRTTSGKCLLSLEQASERWGDHLVIVASQEMRLKALTEDSGDPSLVMSPLQYCLLEHVGQSRTVGRLQRFMAGHFNIDAKMLFFLLKKLTINLGLIRKQKSVICNLPSNNVISNVIRLKRFCSPSRHPFDVMGAAMCKFLAEQPNQMLSFIELEKHYDRVVGKTKRTTIRKVRQRLENLGYAKKVLKRDPSLQKGGKGGRERYYIQLISPLVLGNNEEDEEDDGDDGDIDENKDSVVDNPNLVMELPIIKQIYDYIESKGQQGVTNREINEEIQLFNYERRSFMKHLEARGNIKRVMTYGGRQTILRFVAQPHFEDSSLTQNILEEQKKLAAVEDEVSSNLLAAEEKNGGHLNLDSRCPSPVPSLSLTTPDNKPSQVTYRKLKRSNFIVNLLKQKSVIEGTYPIRKAIHEEEEKEGLPTKMDSRALTRMLNGLIEKGVIKKLKTIIDLKNSLHQVEFYLHSSVEPQDPCVKDAIEACKFRHSGGQTKSEAKKHPVKAQNNVKDEGEESDQENVAWNHDLRFSYGYLAKFPRMQLMHEFMWQIFFGVKQDKPVSRIDYELEHAGTVQYGSTGSDNGLNEPMDSTAQAGTLDGCQAILKHQESFEQNSTLMEGLNRSSMPQSTNQRSSAPQPTNQKSTELHSTNQRSAEPQPTNQKSTKPQPTNKTATPHPTNQESATLQSTNQDSITSDDIVKRNKSTNTGELNSNTHNYGWIGHLQSLPVYEKPLGWVKLNDLLKIMPLSVYCNTVGIVREVDGLNEYYHDPNKIHTAFKDLPAAIRKKLKRKGRYKTALAEIISNMMCAGLVTVERPLPTEKLQAFVYFSRGAILMDTSKEFTVGEPSTKCRQDFPFRQFVFQEFSDVQAFWEDLKYICLRTSYSKKKNGKALRVSRTFKFSDCKTELITEDNIMPPPGDSQGAAGLDSCLFSHLARNWSFRTGDIMKFRIFSSEKRKSRPKSGGRRKSKSQIDVKATRPKSKKRRPITDGSETPAKKQKVEEGPVPADEEKRSTLNVNCHLLALDETDRAALGKKTGMRVTFSPEHDKIIILCKIALELMGIDSYRDPLPFVQIRDILHEYCPKDSLDKTAPSCRSRVRCLMKNPKNALNVKVCIAEFSSMKEFANAKDPTLPFKETFIPIVKRVMELSKTQASNLKDSSKLLSSIDELHKHYKLRKLAITKKPLLGHEDPQDLGQPISTIEDIKHSVAKDIIQITCRTIDKSSNAYNINRMFDDFELDEITKAGRELKKAGVIKRKKDHVNSSRNMPWKLSADYLRLLDPSPKEFITLSTYEEAARFANSCFSVPVNPNRRKIVRIKEETICGGKVAACLSLLVTGKVSVEFCIPTEILSQAVAPIKETCQKTKTKQAETEQNKAALTAGNHLGSVSINEQNETERTGDPDDKSPFMKPKLSINDNKNGGAHKPSSNSKVQAKKTPTTVTFGEDSEKPLKRKRAIVDKDTESQTTKKKAKHTHECTQKFNKQTLTHCKFATNSKPSNTDSSLFTSMLMPHDSDEKGTGVSRPIRIAKLPLHAGVQPKLLNQGHNTLDTVKINHCDIIVRAQKGTSLVAMNNDDGINTVSKDNQSSSENTSQNLESYPFWLSLDEILKDAPNLEEYIKRSKCDQGFNDNDELLVRNIYDMATDGEELGTTMVQLKQILDINPSLLHQTSWSLSKHINSMCNNKLLIKVGHFEEHFVLPSFARIWSVNVKRVYSESLVSSKDPSLLKQSGQFSAIEQTKSSSSDITITSSASMEEQSIDETITVEKEDDNMQPIQPVTSASQKATVPSQECDVEEMDAMPSTSVVTPSALLTEHGETDAEVEDVMKPATQQQSTVVTTSFEKQCKILSCPWLDTDGKLDKEMFTSLLRVVLSAIVGNPGITEARVCKQFMTVVQPVALSHVLQYLIDVGCITKHEMTVTKPSLFSTDVRNISYFIPIPDCLVTLAKLTQK